MYLTSLKESSDVFLELQKVCTASLFEHAPSGHRYGFVYDLTDFCMNACNCMPAIHSYINPKLIL